MKKTLICAALSATISISAYADFQYELSAGYIDAEIDSDDFGFSDSADGFLLGGTIYFDPVNTSKGPLSEAGFLDKSSNIGISFVDIDGSDNLQLNTRVIFGDDLIFEGSYNDLDADSSFSLAIGKYISDTSDVILTYQDFEDSGNTVIDVTYHNVVDLGAESYLGVDFTGGYSDNDINSAPIVGFGLTYFGAPEWGIGFSGSTELGSEGTSTYGLFAEYFFVENVAASLNWENTDIDFGFFSLETTIITLEGRIRF